MMVEDGRDDIPAPEETDLPERYPRGGATPTSGRAIGAFVLALASMVLATVPFSADALAAAPFLVIALAAASIAAALTARAELKQNPGLRGFGLSLVAFLLGAGVLVVNLVPLVVVLLLV